MTDGACAPPGTICALDSDGSAPTSASAANAICRNEKITPRDFLLRTVVSPACLPLAAAVSSTATSIPLSRLYTSLYVFRFILLRRFTDW